MSISNGSLTRWAVTVVITAVVGLAGWGLAAERAHIIKEIANAKAEAVAAELKAETALNKQAKESIDVAVLTNDVHHIKEEVGELKEMVKELLKLERRKTRKAE